MLPVEGPCVAQGLGGENVTGNFSIIAALPEPSLVVSQDMIVVIANDSMHQYLQGDVDGTLLINHFRARCIRH
jgi:hypothetical protein